MVVCICRYVLGQRKTTEKVNITKQRSEETGKKM